MAARERRLASQKKFEKKDQQHKKELEEKPIRIAGTKDDLKSNKVKEKTEIDQAVQREKDKQSAIRDKYPVRIAPPRLNTSELESQVRDVRTGGGGEERVSRDSDSERTQVGEGEGVNGNGYQQDEEGLGLKDDEDPNLVTW